MTATASYSPEQYLCRKCYYTLYGTEAGNCPECGAPYNCRDDRTFWARDEVIHIRRVGLAQKLLIWAVLAAIFGWIIPFAFVIAIPFQFYAVFRLARALGYHLITTILLMFLMFIPLLGLLVLLALNGEATKTMRRVNIRVGLMGPKASDLPPALPGA